LDKVGPLLLFSELLFFQLVALVFVVDAAVLLADLLLDLFDLFLDLGLFVLERLDF